MKHRKLLLIFLFISFFLMEGISQLKTLPKRYLQKVFMDTTSISRPQFLAYPVLAYSPETSWEVGLSALYVRYAKGDTTNRLSEISAFTFYTFQKQYGGYLEHALYSDKNKWFFLGKMKFQSFPLSYYGIGPTSPELKLARVDAFQFQLKERLLRKVYKNIYSGLEFDFHRLARVNFVDYEGIPFYQKPLGHEGSTNLGLGLGLLFDNRHNVLNVRDGLFTEFAFLHYHKSIGSSFTFTTLHTDIRYFKPIRKRNVLAMQALGQFSLGQPPFNQLALMGGEMMMRGYYTGRYRDRNLVAFQTEYRMLPFSFAKRFGATIFASAGAVSPTVSSLKSSNIVFAGGAGFRFLLFPKKDVWTRIDFALTNEGTGVYLFIGEAF